MKKFKTFFIFGLIMFLANVTHAQNWAVCGNEQVALDGEHFVHGDTTVYYMGWKYLIFINSKTKQTQCKDIGNAWVVSGFKSFPLDKPGGMPAKVLEIRQGWEFKYFLVPDAIEVYLAEHQAGNQYLVRTKPVHAGSPIAILERWEGSTGRIREPRYDCITNDIAWKELWEKHRSPSVMIPKVNFLTQMVIVIIPGRTLNSQGVEITNIAEQGDVIQIDFYQKIYRPPSGNTYSTPFGFFLIPRSEKKIIIRQNIQFLQDSPPDWRVVREISPR